MVRYRVHLIIATALVAMLALGAVAWSIHENRRTDVEPPAAGRHEVTHAAVVQLIDDGKAARDRLREQIDAGRAVAQGGKTAEAGVMQALEETLSTARSHHRAPVPAVPQAEADEKALADAHEESTAWVSNLTWITEELATNIRVAEASQKAYREASQRRDTAGRAEDRRDGPQDSQGLRGGQEDGQNGRDVAPEGQGE